MSDYDQLCDEPVANGARYTVFMTRRVYAEYQAWPAEARGALERIMQILASDGPGNLVEKQFKNEDRMRPRGAHAKVMIYTIKDFTKRLYGGFAKGMFICTASDGAKKRNKADRDELQRAADRLAPFLGE